MGMVQITDDIRKLDVTLYGKMTKITDTLSKCRVRIFYTGMNRNRTFISDDFANKLIQSLPYAPVKGIFNYGEVDFEDHGDDNTDGRIYGIIAAEPNFAWESHQDKDGITRQYVCADVIIYSALYPEANLIPEKGQSMEIFKDTLIGEWRVSTEDGLPYYYFIDGSLLGLQVLGDKHEPCFEGAMFFELDKNGKAISEYIKNTKKEDKKKMENNKSIFRLSDSEKADLIALSLNPKYNEENNWQLDKIIYDVYDDYAICRDRASNKFQRVYYTKNDTDDTVTINEIVDVFIVDVTETEKKALEAMKVVGGTYEKSAEIFAEKDNQIAAFEAEKKELQGEIENYTNQVKELTEKQESLENSLSQKDSKIENFSNQVSTLEAEKTSLIEEKDAIAAEKEILENFKKQTEIKEKQAVIEEFSSHLTDSQIKSFTEKLDNSEYTVSAFRKEVCLSAYEADPSTVFKKENNELIFKGTSLDDKNESGVLRLLNKYKNGGNK